MRHTYSMPRKQLTPAERVATAKGESRYLDFKARFDPANSSEWLELIKNIVAMANSGGGLIVIGVHDNGQPCNEDITPVLNIDPAKITDKVKKYTQVQFEDFEVIPALHGASHPVAVIVVGPCIEAPMSFTQVGTYQDPADPKRQKTAFALGTVYFRHGAKSEPGNTNDLRRFIDRRIDTVREQWKRGMRLVTEAPSGTHLALVETTGSDPTAAPVRIRLTNDPNAPIYGQLSPDQTHPYRKAELLPVLNERLGPDFTVNSYDLLAVRRAHGIEPETYPNYVYQGQWLGSSPQYSDEFADWIVNQAHKDPLYFQKARKVYYEMTHGPITDT